MNQQQVTINLPSSHPVKALQGLARAIALPAEYAPSRFPSFPALERTAVMAFTQPTSVTLPASTDVKMMLTRQASYPAWADQTMTGASYTVEYLTQYLPANALSADLIPTPSPINWFQGNRTGSGRDVSVTGSNTTGLLSYPPMGYDLGSGPTPFVYVPPNWNLYVSVVGLSNNLPTGTTGQLSFEKWCSPGEVQLIQKGLNSSVATTMGVFSVNAVTSDGAWYRVSSASLTFPTAYSADFRINLHVVAGTATYTPASLVGGTVAVTGAATTGLFPLTVSSEFANSTLPWYATRTTAAALLGTNVTQILNKAGTVLGGRISPNVISPFSVAKSYITALHPAEKAWLPLETGLYTYAPPSTDLANFWDYTLNTANGAPACPIYRLDNDSLVNILFVTPGAATETLACTISWHIEFRTSSALFQVALSGMTLETFHQAQLSLAAAGFFFDNPDHKSILSKIIGAVNKVAPYALGALEIARPAAGALARKAYELGVQAYNSRNAPRNVPVPKGPMRLPSTTAARSGYGAAPKAKAKGRRKK